MAQTLSKSSPCTPTHLPSSVSYKRKASSLFLSGSELESPCPPPICKKRTKALELAESRLDWTPVNFSVSSPKFRQESGQECRGMLSRRRSTVEKPNGNDSGEFSDWEVCSNEMGPKHPGFVIYLFELSVSNCII